ncbi:MAG TPA: hypothetical protein PLJ21_07055, partial [Pseudobdellovibrionaceae bacterium]|nr:hypothetical protein [Pseudobdellovibrionaceae bacterium]
MKINNLFYYIAFFSLVLGFLTTLPLIQSSIGWSVDQLGALQKENIVEIYKNSFNEKRLYLKNLSNISKADANLSGAYVLSKESKDPLLLIEILDKFKLDSNLSYFELIDLNKIESTNEIINSCLKKHLNSKMNENLCPNHDKIMLSLVAPIYLYGEKVAFMFFGLDLNFDLSLNNRKNQLHIESLKNISSNTKLYELNDFAVTTNLEPDLNSLKNVTDRLRYLVLMGSILSLIFMVAFITLITKKLFLNPFNSILRQLEDAYKAIQNKKHYKFYLKTNIVLENTKLAETLDSFLVKIIDYGNQLEESHQQLIENERNVAIGKISRQVAHDIRSPLTALKIVASKVNELPEAHRNLLLSGVDRISNIANQLLDSYKATNLESQTTVAVPQISYISKSLEELILQFRLI